MISLPNLTSVCAPLLPIREDSSISVEEIKEKRKYGK